MDSLLVDIGSRELLLEWLQKEKGKQICTDESFSYYQVSIYGRNLMYRMNRFRPDGRRCYYLTDTLAKSLGFHSLHEMKLKISSIRYWKKFISVQRIRIAFKRYDERQEKFRQIAKGIEI